MQLDLGILLAEHFESSWKYLGSRRWSIAHVKLSDSSLDPRFRASNCFLGMPQQRPRFFKEFSTGNGQAECLGTPLKQPDRDFVFKITNLPTDSWLRNVQSQSCARNIFLFGGCHEVPEMTKFHASCEACLKVILRQET
jgi:hypothetical protein